MACVSEAAHSAHYGSGLHAKAWLIDKGKRLHLQHGPIDLIVEALGSSTEVRLAYQQATRAFQPVLDTLAAQLAVLREPLSGSVPVGVQGDVARRMFRAAVPLHNWQVTPMIAVAGAVADHICTAMLLARNLERVQVNNGGDIALYLDEHSSCRIGIARQVHCSSHPDIISLNPKDGIRGIATSGWQGRSDSLGVADAVTVLAADSAGADAAATIIANAVDVPGSPKIKRVPARQLNPDSDLGARAVTVSVGRLSKPECQSALRAGALLAMQLLDSGLIKAAYLHLQGHSQIVGQNFKQQNAIQSSSQLSGCRI